MNALSFARRAEACGVESSKLPGGRVVVQPHNWRVAHPDINQECLLTDSPCNEDLCTE